MVMGKRSRLEKKEYTKKITKKNRMSKIKMRKENGK